MNTITNRIVLGCLALLLPACVVGAPGAAQQTSPAIAPAPTQVAPPQAVPTNAAAYPTSGGATIETPEVYTLGSAVEGSLRNDEHRYYEFRVTEEQELTVMLLHKMYYNKMGGGNVGLKITDSLGKRLESIYTATQDSDYTREGVRFKANVNDTITMAISCEGVHPDNICGYKITVE